MNDTNSRNGHGPMDGPERRRQGLLDVAGIGFGPSNLALAIALDEHNRDPGRGRPIQHRFIERQPRFGWHRGMLIDGATMQISFLKDLVTMRNPTSDFSFVSYLHEHDRLAGFINFQSFFPLRAEFHDYLEWAAGRLAHSVSYGEEVVAVDPVVEGGTIVAFDVVSTASTRRATNVVVAAGLQPQLPDGIVVGERVWHSADLLPGLDRLGTVFQPRRVVVVGAGQSAAEVAALVHDRFPAAEICAVFSRFGYAPADGSPFANQIFDPGAVELYHDAPDEVKEMLLTYHRGTNYSVVDHDLIVDLYRRSYQERVGGRERLRILNVSRVRDVAEGPTGVAAVIESLPTGERSTLDADLVIFATGYRPADPLRLLGEAGRHCALDDQGRIKIGLDCRLELSGPARASIFVQGAAEHAHGLGSTLLSTVAVRAGHVTDALVGAEAPVGPGRFDGQSPTSTLRYASAEPTQ